MTVPITPLLVQTPLSPDDLAVWCASLPPLHNTQLLGQPEGSQPPLPKTGALRAKVAKLVTQQQGIGA